VVGVTTGTLHHVMMTGAPHVTAATAGRPAQGLGWAGSAAGAEGWCVFGGVWEGGSFDRCSTFAECVHVCCTALVSSVPASASVCIELLCLLLSIGGFLGPARSFVRGFVVCVLP
jgi:hypothetical protein